MRLVNVRSLLLLVLSVIALSSGCSHGKGSVSGTVTWNGNPLPSGTISFYSETGNKEVFNAAIQNGNYSIEGIPAGKARIAIRVTQPGALPAAPAAPGARPQVGAGDAIPAVPIKPGRPADPASTIPGRYSDPETSGLTLDIQPGAQTFPITLTP